MSIELRSPPDPLVACLPEARKIRTCRWIGLLLSLVIALSTYPAWKHVSLATAPDWARVVWLVAALEAVYVLWMLAAPDWASLWVLTLVFALVAAAYGTATAMAMAALPDSRLPLGMDTVGETAPQWCGLVALVHLLAAYLCGHASVRWRRWFEQQRGAASRWSQPGPFRCFTASTGAPWA